MKPDRVIEITSSEFAHFYGIPTSSVMCMADIGDERGITRVIFIDRVPDPALREKLAEMDTELVKEPEQQQNASEIKELEKLFSLQDTRS